MPDRDLEKLKTLLDDAVAAARDVGDDARAEPTGIGYFADADASGITAAIETIAAHDGEISLFVGAGVSMEAGLPSWHELVRELLLRAREPGDEEQAVDEWASAVLQEGPLAAAAVAEALYEDPSSFRRALRDALYTQGPSSYVPGALAGQIAWLKERIGSRLALLTVNYDGLIEAALRERGIEAVSYVRGRREPENRAAVWHLHGRLMRTRTGKDWLHDGNLVLSEGSYVKSTSASFPQEFVAERLRGSLCVFIGLSMTDPNFIRWLYRSSDEFVAPRFVIFVRQASPVSDPRVREILEQSAIARWAQYNVTPVWANYYGEVAQIVHEIGLRCHGGTPTDFSVRARDRLEKGRQRLSPPTAREFVDAQTETSEWLRKRIADIAAYCRAAEPRIDLTEHQIGLGLFAVDHELGSIINWVSADRAYQQPEALVANPLHVRSRWVAAVAVASGVPIEQDPRVYASRWRFIRAIPVVVKPEDERSIVGAVTLTSTTPLEEFPLAKQHAPPGLLNVIDATLCHEVGEFFLD